MRVFGIDNVTAVCDGVSATALVWFGPACGRVNSDPMVAKLVEGGFGS